MEVTIKTQLTINGKFYATGPGCNKIPILEECDVYANCMCLFILLFSTFDSKLSSRSFFSSLIIISYFHLIFFFFRSSMILDLRS